MASINNRSTSAKPIVCGQSIQTQESITSNNKGETKWDTLRKVVKRYGLSYYYNIIHECTLAIIHELLFMIVIL